MVKKVAAFVAEYEMIKEQDRVIAGISGGADSVCLLLMLLELRKNISFDIVAVHVNHGLRGDEALRDEHYVKVLCENYQIPLEIYHKDVELFAQKRKQSLEEAGRYARIEAFQQAVAKYKGTKIALAHHMNDNAETMLMNLARGSGLAGLTGIRPVNGITIRPLLCLERQEIESFLASRKISYCTDVTNGSDDYTRNRIRNHVLPFLEREVNEKTVSHMADTAEQILKIWEYMEEETEIYYKKVVEKTERGFLIKKSEYIKLPEVFRGTLLKMVLKKMAQREQDIHRIHILSLDELMEKQTGRKINLPYGIVAERCYEGIRVLNEEKKEEHIVCEVIDFERESGLHINNQVFSFEILKTDARQEEKVYTKYFDYDIIKRTITLRTRRAGDYITIDGEGRKQKLKSFFINEKIPQEERDHILLLAEGSHVLWVIGYRRGHAYYVGPNTEKIVKITMNKGEDKDGRDN